MDGLLRTARSDSRGSGVRLALLPGLEAARAVTLSRNIPCRSLAQTLTGLVKMTGSSYAFTSPTRASGTSTAPAGVRLHLGCGLNVVPGWVNVDGSWNARLAKYPLARRALASLGVIPRAQFDVPWSPDVRCFDVTKPLPYGDTSVKAIYASHLLEHLYHEDARRLLRECHRVLAPSGILRLVVPDIRAIISEYLDNVPAPDDTPAADRVNERLLLRERSRGTRGLLYSFYTSATDFHSHKWMYDGESLAWHMRNAGFTEVSIRDFCDSGIEDIEAIEQASRVLHGAGVCVEGVKT